MSLILQPLQETIPVSMKLSSLTKSYINKYPMHNLTVDQDRTVGIATHYGLNGPGIESWGRARFSAPIQTGPGAHPASYTMGTGSSPGVKQLGCDIDHPPHLVLRLKKEWAIHLHSLCSLLACFRVIFIFIF